MQQQVLWGERVMGAPYPFKVVDLANLPDDAYTYEIVEGELIRMPRLCDHLRLLPCSLREGVVYSQR